MTDLDSFAAEATSFLEANASRRPEGESPLREALLVEADESRALREARAWRARRFEAGLGWITGPLEYGGRALTVRHDRLYRAREADFDTPPDVLAAALDIVGTALERHGSLAAKERYLRGLYRGDLAACQLFSEPEAGSDLASVRTSAVRDGDGWVVSGQKVWTTGAHDRELGEIICRTDPHAPKHRGITLFLLELDWPGVEVRGLRDMTGRRHFNEVFLSEVRIPDENRLGEVDAGWQVLRTSLAYERAVVAGRNERRAGGFVGTFTPWELAATMKRFGLDRDPAARERLADLVVRFEVARWATEQVNDRLERGELPGPELSITKLTLAENLRLLADAAAAMLGPAIAAENDDPVAVAWATALLSSPAMRLAGGTDEILRSVLGERVLGLPRDPAIDDSVPFDQVPDIAPSVSAVQEALGDLRDSVRAFVQSTSSEVEVRRLMETPEGFDEAIWARMAGELELQGMAIPEAVGGSGFGMDAQAVVFEELGAALMCTPYLSTFSGAQALLAARDDRACRELLPAVAAGRTRLTLAFLEREGRMDAGPLAVATAGSDGYRVSGEKLYVLDGHTADLLVVSATLPDGATLFIVEGDGPGVERALVSGLDPTRKLARVRLQGARARLLGEPGGAGTTLSAAIDRAAVALAAEAVGGASACLEASAEYAKDRFQFGRPIGSFQAVKHKCAEMLRVTELARAASTAAARAMTNATPDAPRAASIAKAFCSEAFSWVATENIHVHGGTGFTWEHPAHLFFRRAKSSEQLFGGPAYHRELVLRRSEI